MITRFFQLLGALLTLLALWLFWGDVRANDEAARLLGQVWYEAAPGSLQLTEAVVDRYIDPCGLMPFLGCDTFIWHPFISTLLNWPAGLVLGLLGVITSLISSTVTKRSRKSVRHFKKEGR